MEQIQNHLISSAYGVAARAVSRIHPVTILLTCVGIIFSYYIGIYLTGHIHSASRWLGAALSCTSFVTIMQMPNYKASLRPGLMRIIGTFIGAVIAYIYLRLLPFSVLGMLLTIFTLESFCMLLGIYSESRIATITLVIIMLVSQMFPEENPIINCLLRFFESAVGVGVGLALRWSVERWAEFRERAMHRGRQEDGSHLNLDTMPLRWGHLRIVAITSLGQLTGAALSTLIGIVIPLMHALTHHTLSPLAQGILASMSLVGIMFGSVFIGEWSDRRGYLSLFRLSPILILIGALAATFTTSIPILTLALFVMGFGVGGGYSLDSDYISELMPRRRRELMVGVAKAASAIGNILMAFVCLYILRHWRTVDSWNGLFALIAILAIIMIFCSARFTQSPQWLLAHNRREEAEHTLRQLLGEDVDLPLDTTTTASAPSATAYTPAATSATTSAAKSTTPKRRSSTIKSLRRAIFCGVPWACEGFGVYGVGVFLPVLVMYLGISEGTRGTLGHVTTSVEMTSYINLFVGVGFLLGLILLGKMSHTRQQIIGFLLSASGIALLAAGYIMHLHEWIIISGLIIYNIFINAGPHLITFILPSKVYPITSRGEGAGIAAALGKAGAVLGVFMMPLLLDWGGMELVLTTVAIVLILGALVTGLFSDLAHD